MVAARLHHYPSTLLVFSIRIPILNIDTYKYKYSALIFKAAKAKGIEDKKRYKLFPIFSMMFRYAPAAAGDLS